MAHRRVEYNCSLKSGRSWVVVVLGLGMEGIPSTPGFDIKFLLLFIFFTPGVYLGVCIVIISTIMMPKTNSDPEPL